MTHRFERQNRLKDLGFVPYTDPDFKYCLGYGPAYNGTHAISYKEETLENVPIAGEYTFWYFGYELEMNQLTFDEQLTDVQLAIDVLKNTNSILHENKVYTRSTN